MIVIDSLTTFVSRAGGEQIQDFFNEMKKYSQELGKLAKVPYAECYWQHLGKGFQKDPIIQKVLEPHIVYV